MMIDLHAHSTMSDGTDTPAELMRNAALAGLDVIALTDHDTTAGWAAAAAALPPGLSLVRGAELSCVSPDGQVGTCTVHLLAYVFDPTAQPIIVEQTRLRVERRLRLHRMAVRMATDGYPVDPDALIADLPEGSSAGRPHLARALVNAGVVGSVSEAFESLLSSAGRYHIQRADTPVLRAIELINEAGGVTVLAHAFARHHDRNVTPAVIKDLAAAGLTGLEVNHPDHDLEHRAQLTT